MFCVKCGCEGKELIKGLCIDCFLDGRKLLSMPHHVDLFRCTNCEEFSIGDQWVKKTLDEAITDIALTQLSAIPEAKVVSVGTAVEKQEDKTFVAHIQVDLDIEGFQTTDETSIIVRLKNSVCKKCSRQLGSYYEAILQIRSGEKRLDKAIQDEIVGWITDSVETQSKTNKQLFITKFEGVTGGVDVYLSSISLGKSLTRSLSEKYGAEIKESAKLVSTSSDGLEVYRVTYLVRLPQYHVGDVVKHNGKICELTAINKSGGKVTNLTDFKESNVKKNDLAEIKVLIKSKDIQNAIVVSKSGGEIQVLHPQSLQTVDISVPKGAEIGETVKVADVEGDLFYII